MTTGRRMVTRRSPEHVPGFAPPLHDSRPAPTEPKPDAPPATARSLHPIGACQLNVRVPIDLRTRYRHLLRDLEDAGIESSMTELVNAVLLAGPSDESDARGLLRALRSAAPS